MSYKKVINFDSIYGIKNYDSNPTIQASHIYNITLPLYNPLHQVKRISLVSCEMPIIFSNMRSSNLSNTLYVYVTSGTFANQEIIFSVVDTNYSSIDSFIAGFNANATNPYINFTLSTFALNGVNYIKANSTDVSFTFKTDTPLLSKILGFSVNQVSNLAVTVNNIKASNPPNLNIDNCLYMYFPNLPIASNNASGTTAHFKIPITVTSYNINFFTANSGFNQTLQLYDNNTTIDKLKVIILDRFGNPINGFNTAHYSFSLLFEYDSLY